LIISKAETSYITYISILLLNHLIVTKYIFKHRFQIDRSIYENYSVAIIPIVLFDCRYSNGFILLPSFECFLSVIIPTISIGSRHSNTFIRLSLFQKFHSNGKPYKIKMTADNYIL
jgi:hypothetical protein